MAKYYSKCDRKFGFFKYGEIIIRNENLETEKFNLGENKNFVETLLKAGICQIYINDLIET